MSNGTSSPRVEPWVRILRYLYTGLWKDSGALDGIHSLSRAPAIGATFEADAETLRAYLCKAINDWIKKTPSPQIALELSGVGVNGTEFSVAAVLSDRIDRNDFPDVDRMLIVLAACVHPDQPVEDSKPFWPLITRYCNSSSRLFRFLSIRFMIAGRQSKRARNESRGRGQQAGGTDAGSSSRRCWSHHASEAVRNFYTRELGPVEVMDFARDVTSHRAGDDWTHKDVIRLVHPSPATDEMQVVMHYLLKGIKACRESPLSTSSLVCRKITTLLEACEAVHACKKEDAAKARSILEDNGLTWRHVPPRFHRDPVVWEYLVNVAPLRVLISRFRAMSQSGLLSPGGAVAKMFADRFSSDEDAIKRLCSDYDGTKADVKERKHSVAIFALHKLYRDPAAEAKFRTVVMKKAMVGKPHLPPPKLMPGPVPEISAAFEKLLHRSFEMMAPTGLRWLLLLDRSPLTLKSHCNYMESVMVNEAIAVLTWLWLCSEKAGDVDLATVGPKNKITAFKKLNRGSGFHEVFKVFSEAETSGRATVADVIEYAKREGVANKSPYDAILVLTVNLEVAVTTPKSSATPAPFDNEIASYVRDVGKPNFKVIVNGLASRNVKLTPNRHPRVLYVRGMDDAIPWSMRAFAKNAF